MLKRLFPALATLCFASTAHAACTGPGAEALFSADEIDSMKAAAHAAPYSDSIFWRADKDGREIHVTGTVHIHDPRLANVMARFTPALESADLLLVELTRAQQADMETQMLANPQLLLLPEGQSMIDVLEPETWAEVSDALTSIGVNPLDALPLQPWFLSLNLALPPCAIASLQAGEVGLDVQLEQALPDGTPAASLETWEESLSFFTAPDFEEQAQELLLNIATFPYADALTVATLDAYFAGEPGFVWEVMKSLGSRISAEQTEEYASYMERMQSALLKDRNTAWMEVIEAASANHSSVFVAVGAMHLGGEFGVLKLLEAQGWTITKM